MLVDTEIVVIETPTPAPPKPRVRFQDYRCNHCGRLLMRASLGTIALALPQDFKDTHPLLMTALAAVVCEIRCPKCGVTNSFKPTE